MGRSLIGCVAISVVALGHRQIVELVLERRGIKKIHCNGIGCDSFGFWVVIALIPFFIICSALFMAWNFWCYRRR
jgi:hypothetical protein